MLKLLNFRLNSNVFVSFNTLRRRVSYVCWKCGNESNKPGELFCNSCEIIQKPTTNNYFKLFGLKEEYRIDQRLLKDKFRHMQSLLHPDKFSNRTAEEKAISDEYSSLINKAYNNLQTPLKRAIHLLNLQGESIEENETVADPSFLMDVMTLNEEVEDAGNNIEKLKDLNVKNKKKLEELSNEINKNFVENDVVKAKENVAKMKYFSSLDKRINSTLRELGATD